MKEKSTAAGIRNKLKEIHSRLIMRDPFNIPAMIAVMDAAAKLFPNTSKNESLIRSKDRSALESDELQTPVLHAPGLVDGQLNRKKILMGTALFYDDETVSARDFERIRDAGFDFLIGAGGRVRELALEKGLEYSIAVISANPDFPGGGNVREAVLNGSLDFSSYRKHPAQAGDMGWDEPNAADFSWIGAYTKAYREALPGQFPRTRIPKGRAGP